MKYFINKYMDYDCIYLNSTEYGFLQLYVVHNVVDTPIEGAEVTVYKVSYELPVLNELLPGNDYYYITVRADGYNNAFIMNVQVYSNILTSYKVSLIHYGYSDVEFNFMIQPTRTEMHNPNHIHQRNHDSRRP
ncbi:MAG: hypothetical protein K0Q47_1435 [Sedimentibacter sp.]|nr:hypothetical protein [Sedimentibacter sp.]